MDNFLTNSSKISQFFQAVSEAVKARDVLKIEQLFRIDVQNSSYHDELRRELQARYPASGEDQLERVCDAIYPAAEWASIKPFAVRYLRLLRDLEIKTATSEIHGELKTLTDQGVVALGDSTYGALILPTVLNLSRGLSQLASKIENGAGAKSQNVAFVEECANTLRDAFIKCLVGGGTGTAAHSTHPEGKRTGVYLTANSCLRLLFQCRKLRNAQQMFVSIDAQSPFLSFYPRAQRVTYLFYLGRYHFANNHFYRAQLALQGAYDICHQQAIQHRKHILIYLIAANICLGRFPSSILLSTPEAASLAPHFHPLRQIISRGDLGSFHAYLDLNSPSAQWFLQKRVLLQLRNRCEVLVWRALIRNTFRCVGFQGDGQTRQVPFMRLNAVKVAARWTLSRSTRARSRLVVGHQDSSVEGYTDPDLDGIDAAVVETGFDVYTGTYLDEQVNQDQDPVFLEEEQHPSAFEVESIMSSLIQQGFLRGFLTHNNPRFAIPGSTKGGGPLAVGFPNVWEVIKSREDDTVPGWVREEEKKATPAGFGGGMSAGGFGGGGRVINLKGARPAGAGVFG